ncbi:hypothetical protein JL09_g6736, partial [Pichia kudriavzevii]
MFRLIYKRNQLISANGVLPFSRAISKRLLSST